jgi:hypothetical protein
MFLGHFGVGFGAKRFAPRASLGTLFLAALFADLLWPTLLLLGVERVRIAPGITRVTPLDFVSYPISHSLALIALWGLVFAALYWAARRYASGTLAAVSRPRRPTKPSVCQIPSGRTCSRPQLQRRQAHRRKQLPESFSSSLR